ncbi:Fcf1-domain-containing protein [Biscogniauxia sp. FL1348]|nr:Fcf1-domain-containing protein [Biscogniauxia sp. FL1348]
MRHLYAHKSASAIELAKTFERRRCGHHPDQYPEPLSTLECLMSVVDPKGQGVNKFKYCGAINDEDVRAALRRIPGVPLVYIRRSVMIMEPMAAATAKVRSREERLKFRAELKTIEGGKRKRDAEEDTDDEDSKEPTRQAGEANKPEKKKKKKGPKGPNPLSVKKKKAGSTPGTELQSDKPKKTEEEKEEQEQEGERPDDTATGDAGSEEAPKKKRRRKHKSKNADATSTSEQASHDVEAEA